MSLKGKTIIVVGAAGLLGRQIVASLVEQDAQVVAVDRNIDSLQTAFNAPSDRVKLLVGDITDRDSIRSILQDSRFEGFDGAVNTAYPRNANYGRKFFEVTYEDFCENVSLHLGGYFLFMQQCAEYAISTKRSFSLVNLSSVYGVIPPRFEIYEGLPMTMPVEYAAIKAALIQLNGYVGAYMKGSGFRVNSVSPGGIYDGQSPTFKLKYDAHCRKKGMLDPADVMGAITFLLSDSSQFVCSQNVVVDDGFAL